MRFEVNQAAYYRPHLRHSRSAGCGGTRGHTVRGQEKEFYSQRALVGFDGEPKALKFEFHLLVGKFNIVLDEAKMLG